MEAKADIKFKDGYGHTAFHLACENGHIEVLELLYGKDEAIVTNSSWFGGGGNEKFSDKNNFFNLRNIYGKNALMVATEFRQIKCVEWILETYNDERYVNSTKNDNPSEVTSVFHACTPDPNIDQQDEEKRVNDVSLEILDLLIRYGARVDHCAKNTTPLIWAASHGAVEHVKVIIKKLLNVVKDDEELKQFLNYPAFSGSESPKILDEFCIVDSSTALMRAAERGHTEIITTMLNNQRIKKLLDFNCCLDTEDHNSRRTAIHLALIDGNFAAAEKLTHKQEFEGEMYDLRGDHNSPFLNDDDLIELVSRLSNVELNSQKWCDLAELAAQYPFYFRIFRKLLHKSASISRILGICGRPFLKRLYDLDESDLIDRLIRYLCCLKYASDSKPWEAMEIAETTDIISHMIRACFDAQSLSNQNNLVEVLCRKNHTFPHRETIYRDLNVRKAQAFSAGPLVESMKCDVNFVFTISQVNYFTNELFYTNLKAKRNGILISLLNSCKMNRDTIVDFFFKPLMLGPIIKTLCLSLPDAFNEEAISQLGSNIIFCESNLVRGRYCPGFMFFMEGISKAVTLFLISWVALVTYDKKSDLSSQLSPEEVMLAILMFSHAIYEFGELCGTNAWFLPNYRGILSYVTDIWNWFDDITLGLLFGWFHYRCSGQEHFVDFKALISVATIPYSLSILRYLCLWEPIGKLQLTVVKMTADLGGFAVLFIVCVFGFWVALYGLMKYDDRGYENDDFGTVRHAMVTLFSSTFANYNNNIFFLETRYQELGAVIMVIYIVATVIVLLNLIIARMSATFDKVSEISLGEYHLNKAGIVRNFIRFEETHPFCMLAPPFNLITFLLSPFHFCFLLSAKDASEENDSDGEAKRSSIMRGRQFTQSNIDKNEKENKNRIISFSGTIADIGLGCPMSFVAPILELFYFLYKSFRGHVFKSNSHAETIAKFIQTIFIVIVFPLMYPIYSCILLFDVLRDNFYPYPQPSYPTVHKKKSQFALHYKKDPRYKSGNREVENSKSVLRYLSIKIIKYQKEKVDRSDDHSDKFVAPVVQISMGAFGNISGTPVSSDVQIIKKDDSSTGKSMQTWTYSDTNMNFPLEDSFSDSAGNSISITVLDKGNHTEFTEVMDETSNYLVDSWISSNRFEGKLELKGGSMLQITAAVMSNESKFAGLNISPVVNLINDFRNDDRDSRARDCYKKYFDKRYDGDQRHVMSQKFLYAPTITFDEHERKLIFRDIDNYRSIDHQHVFFTKLHEKFGELGEHMGQRFENLRKEIIDLIHTPHDVMSPNQFAGVVEYDRNETHEASI